jgi:hypothetical protein
MDKSKLMDRTDTKFTFSVENLVKVLNEVKGQYKILEIGNCRMSTYQTLYYDTSDLSLYLKHHNGKLNRYKVRHRTYVESKLGFLEVKFKNNKGRTIKKRIKVMNVPHRWEQDASAFITARTPFSPETLVPNIWVNYKRITLVNNENAERVTIDTELEFVSQDSVKKMHNLVIAEVKQEKRSVSAFLLAMKKFRIREGSISKYCMGVALTHKNIKQNNFKEKLISLNHIIYAGNHITTNS